MDPNSSEHGDDTSPSPSSSDDSESSSNNEMEGTLVTVELNQQITNAGNNADDIAMVRAMGMDVDDDNEPVQENMPEENERVNERGNGLKEGQSWGWNGFDERRKENIYDTKAKINGLSGVALQNCSFTTMFQIFFASTIGDMVITETNKVLDVPMDMGEWLRFVGILLLLSTVTCFNRRDFWSTQPIDIEFGAPYRFNDWMSLHRFEAILTALTFTDEDRPEYRDRFWTVRKMIELWNDNMREVYCPSWVSCLDESMSIWLSKFTCPGWVFCPRKPHPFGNEYHSISDANTNIMYAIEMVEGKDAPKERPPPEHSDKGPTVGLLLRLTAALFNTGKVVILDSGFCVLQGLIELRKVGVFSSAVIKKRRYWPKHVPGDIMDERMKDKPLGACDSIKGIMDEVPYNLFCMKDKDFVMKLMSTYGGLVETRGQEKTWRWFKANRAGGNSILRFFRYKEPFANHYKYRHCVDDHNNLRHSIPSIEGSIKTHRWELRVFCFILAISEVNTFLALKNFVWCNDKFMTLHQFRRKLAMALINNEHIRKDVHGNMVRSRRKRRNIGDTEHVLCSAPPHAKKFFTRKWDLSCKAKYQQYQCRVKGCTQKTRTYCKCSPGEWMCKSCHPEHIVQHVTDKSS